MSTGSADFEEMVQQVRDSILKTATLNIYIYIYIYIISKDHPNHHIRARGVVL
jgi:hypothetical protein